MRMLPGYTNREANFRLDPYIPKSTDNTNIIELLPNKHPVVIIEGVTHSESGYVWQYVVANSKRGWVVKSFLNFSALPQPPAPTPVVTSGWGRHYLGADTAATTPTDTYVTAKAVEWFDPLIELYKRKPNGIYFYRKYYSEAAQNYFLNLMLIDMDAALNLWFKDNDVAIKTMPWAIHEGFNEVDAPNQYIEFERRRVLRLAFMKLNNGQGVRASILNLSVGRSDEGMWRRALPAVVAANENGGYVGEHSYWQSLPSNGTSHYDKNGNIVHNYIGADGKFYGEIFPDNVIPEHCWTGLRILNSKKILANLGQPNTRLVASELGTDDVGDPSQGRYYLFGEKTSGWRANAPLWDRAGWPQMLGTDAGGFFKMQLNWWVKMTGMLGHVFTHGVGGDSKWLEDDTRGLL